MADMHQIITLGIGNPAGIQEFLTFGLQIGSNEVDAGEGQNSVVGGVAAPVVDNQNSRDVD